MLPALLLVPSLRQNLAHSLKTSLIWGLSLPAIGSYILGTIAFQLAPIGEVTLLFTTSPLFIIGYKLLARIAVRRMEIVGLLGAGVGMVLMLLPQLFQDNPSGQAIVGYLLALGTAALLAIYTFWLNKLADQRIISNSVNVVFATCLLGGILSFICTCWPSTLFSESFAIAGLNQSNLLILLGLGIVSTASPFWFYTIAARRLPVILTTSILLLEPMFATLFASIALQEIPSPWFGLGSILVLWGLLMIAKLG